MKYERLTERIGKGICIKETSTNDNKSIWNAINRLAELEDDLESGKMIRLPCKVGDTIWFIRATDREIIEAVVTRIVFNTELSNTELSFEVADKYCDYIVFAKGIFLTKAEAEAKLKELKGE